MIPMPLDCPRRKDGTGQLREDQVFINWRQGMKLIWPIGFPLEKLNHIKQLGQWRADSRGIDARFMDASACIPGRRNRRGICCHIEFFSWNRNEVLSEIADEHILPGADRAL
jgi:hypothetical protein